MAHQKIHFLRLQQKIDRHEFRALEKVHFPANSGRRLSHWAHFSFWLFALARQATSLRDAVTAMAAVPEKFYHAGLKSVRLSTVSEANSKRNPAMYCELFFLMLEKYRRNLPRRMRGALRIIDSTTIAFSDSRFFKWLKQNLKMRRMLGFSENAVQLQIWISLIFDLLLWRMYAIAKENASGFLEFLRHFRSRLLLPESQYPKQSSPKLPPYDWLPGFPLIPAEQ